MNDRMPEYRIGSEIRHDWPIYMVWLAMIGVGIWALPQLPARVATHFGLNGQANGWMSPIAALAFPIGVSILLWLFLIIVPVIDPRRRNYPAFLPFYRSLRLLLVLVLAFTFFSSIWRNLGHAMQIGDVAVLVVGLLFMFIGNSLGRVRHNYFVGVRTPWTLANEEVWRRTHRFGGPVFMIGGLLPVVLLPFWPQAARLVLLVCVVAAALSTVVYSYVAYRQVVGS